MRDDKGGGGGSEAQELKRVGVGVSWRAEAMEVLQSVWLLCVSLMMMMMSELKMSAAAQVSSSACFYSWSSFSFKL